MNSQNFTAFFTKLLVNFQNWKSKVEEIGVWKRANLNYAVACCTEKYLKNKDFFLGKPPASKKLKAAFKFDL